jgi:hypothetical protein
LLRIQELNRKLMRRLERTLEQAQSKPSSDTSLAVFKRVGLSENVPLHVFLACRASYRRRHHPDGRPEHEKEAAIKLFQEFEVIFSRIATIRSWSGREGCGRP